MHLLVCSSLGAKSEADWYQICCNFSFSRYSGAQNKRDDCCFSWKIHQFSLKCLYYCEKLLYEIWFQNFQSFQSYKPSKFKVQKSQFNKEKLKIEILTALISRATGNFGTKTLWEASHINTSIWRKICEFNIMFSQFSTLTAMAILYEKQQVKCPVCSEHHYI